MGQATGVGKDAPWGLDLESRAKQQTDPCLVPLFCSYAQAGPALGLDLINNPDIVGKDASVAFRTALWFWMTPQNPKPACHDVMSGG